MKSKDFLSIGVIGIISVILSLVISSKVFVTPTDRHQKVEIVPNISTNFNTTYVKNYIDSNSVDPTVTICIGNGTCTSSNPQQSGSSNTSSNKSSSSSSGSNQTSAGITPQ